MIPATLTRAGSALMLSVAAAMTGCVGDDPPPAGPVATTLATRAATHAATTPAATTRRRAQALSSDILSGGVLLSELLPYLEQQYGHLLGSNATTQHAGGYTYRCYTPTGNCVGFDSTTLYGMGPGVGSVGTPVRLAALDDFCRATPQACGTRLNRQMVVGGLTRDYIVYIPWLAIDRAASPVVFMLHGTSGTGAEFFERSGWREKADQEGLIAVFPTALRHCHYDDDNANGVFDSFERVTPTKWADGKLGQPAEMPLCTEDQRKTLPAEAAAATDHPLADDVAFFRGMVTELTTKLGADARRVYVTGFSNGANMTLRLASEASDLVAAAAANGGGTFDGRAAAPRPLSMVFMVGELDDRFTGPLGGPLPYAQDMGTTPAWQNLVSSFHTVLSLANTPYTWQPATLFGDTMGVYRYRSSTATPAGGNELIAVVVKGLTHRYPNYMPDALWPWFSGQSLP